LYVKSERIFSAEYLGGIVRLFALFFSIVAVIYGIYEIDKNLKKTYLREQINSSLDFDEDETDQEKKE
jgi:uncharacterized membrane protein